MHITPKTPEMLYDKYCKGLLNPGSPEGREHIIAQLFVDMSTEIYDTLLPVPVGKKAENKRHLAIERINRKWNELRTIFIDHHEFSPIQYDGFRELMIKWIAGSRR
jgi:hypothetical protein